MLLCALARLNELRVIVIGSFYTNLLIATVFPKARVLTHFKVVIDTDSASVDFSATSLAP